MEELKLFFEGKYIDTVLDIGTGSGQFIKELLKVFPDSNYIGVDPNPQWFEDAKKIFSADKVQFQKMDAETLNFKDDSFDLVSLSNALHHLPQLEKSLSEIKRVVKPNGWIVISELVNDNLNPAQENQKFHHHLKSYIDRIKGVYHHETWKRQEIIEIILQNKIDIKIHFDHFNPKKFITETENIDFWVNRLTDHFNEIKGYPQYESLLPKISEFRERLVKNGMQHATNLVIIGQK